VFHASEVVKMRIDAGVDEVLELVKASKVRGIPLNDEVCISM
jgi:hypothetical protein